MLQLNNIEVMYNGVILVLKGICLLYTSDAADED